MRLVSKAPKKRLVSLQQLSYCVRVSEGDLVKPAQSLSFTAQRAAHRLPIAQNNNIVE